MEISFTSILSLLPMYSAYLVSFILLLYVLIKKEIPQIKFLKKIIVLQIIAFVVSGVGLSIMQYLKWSSGDISKFLLPPHESISYFISYIYTHFFNYFLFTLGFAILVFYTIKLLNKKFNNKFFYEQEKYLCVIGFFANPFPLLIVFLILVFIANLGNQIISNIKSKNRISFLNFWIPCIIISLLISQYIIKTIPLLNGLIL